MTFDRERSGVIELGLAPVVVALVVSAVAMAAGGLFGSRESAAMIEQIGALHRPQKT